MTTTSLGFEVRLDEPFDSAVECVTTVLGEQGFGILSSIDVQGALKNKLDIDFREYVILGACNPQLAHRALSARPDVGLLLPCNVTVESDPDGGAIVRIADPKTLMETGGFDSDPAVSAVAAEARELLSQVAESLA